jgi:hypothetical protein
MSEQKPWDGIDRRGTPLIPTGANPPNSEFWGYLVQQLQSLDAQMKAMHIDMVGQKATLNHVQDDVEEIKRGFPKDEDGGRDYDGHHDHHEQMIKSAKKWGDIWTDVAKKLFGGIAWVCVVFVAYALWDRFIRAVKGDIH